MKPKKHIIQLSTRELAQVKSTIRKGKHNARVITRARILLLSHQGKIKDEIAGNLEIARGTVQRVWDRFRHGGLTEAFSEDPRPGQPPKITDEGEAYLVALASSSPPEGEAQWTLELLRERIVKDGKVPKEITAVALWQHLDKRHIKPWREKNVVHPHHNPRVH